MRSSGWQYERNIPCNFFQISLNVGAYFNSLLRTMLNPLKIRNITHVGDEVVFSGIMIKTNHGFNNNINTSTDFASFLKKFRLYVKIK